MAEFQFPTYEQMAKDVAEKALDEILYDGKSIREWIKIIAEPKTGHWIDGFCSKCGKEAITEWNDTGGELCLSDYCPNCGARMET